MGGPKEKWGPKKIPTLSICFVRPWATVGYTDTYDLACIDILMYPHRTPKTRPVWPTLWRGSESPAETKWALLGIFHLNVTTLRSGLCYRKSMCLSVVCNVRALYSGGWTFRQYFFTTESQPSYDLRAKFWMCKLGLNVNTNIPKRKRRFPSHQISWVIDWLIRPKYAIFLRGLAQQWRLQKKQNLAQR